MKSEYTVIMNKLNLSLYNALYNIILLINKIILYLQERRVLFYKREASHFHKHNSSYQ